MCSMIKRKIIFFGAELFKLFWKIGIENCIGEVFNLLVQRKSCSKYIPNFGYDKIIFQNIWIGSRSIIWTPTFTLDK